MGDEEGCKNTELKSDLWTKATTKQDIRCPYNEYWAKLRVKEDSGEQYFDILIGKRGEEPHIHLGINLDQTLRFNEGRGIEGSISRKVESQNYGLMSDGKIIVDKNIDGSSDVELHFELDMVGETREVIIKEFELNRFFS
ncbi:MAG: hypothetical protein R6U10_04795 [Thermoplasmatota archaeon]